VAARAAFAWSDGGLQSDASVDVEGLTFQGPGVAVAQTRDVTGTLTFSELIPLTSEGVQELRIGALDLRALQLVDGVVRFDMPGDDTVGIASATFPWFGGRLFATDGGVGFDGSTAIALEASGIELGTVLSYIDVNGLSGEGRIGGRLPLRSEGLSIVIDDGVLTSEGPGVIRYVGGAADAIGEANEGARLAADIIEEIRYDRLVAGIDGQLDGDLLLNLRFEGASDVDLDAGGAAEVVRAPVILRANIEVPVRTLFDQARLSLDEGRLIERALEGERPPAQDPQEE
jgi:hypothetical protein